MARSETVQGNWTTRGPGASGGIWTLSGGTGRATEGLLAKDINESCPWKSVLGVGV